MFPRENSQSDAAFGCMVSAGTVALHHWLYAFGSFSPFGILSVAVLRPQLRCLEAPPSGVLGRVELVLPFQLSVCSCLRLLGVGQCSQIASVARYWCLVGRHYILTCTAVLQMYRLSCVPLPINWGAAAGFRCCEFRVGVRVACCFVAE